MVGCKSVGLIVHGVGNGLARGAVLVVKGFLWTNRPSHLVHPVLGLLALIGDDLEVDEFGFDLEGLLDDDDAEIAWWCKHL